MAIDQQKIDHWFKTPGKLSQVQCVSLDEIRTVGHKLSTLIKQNTPACAEQSKAMTAAREAVMWSEEAIRLGTHHKGANNDTSET